MRQLSIPTEHAGIAADAREGWHIRSHVSNVPSVNAGLQGTLMCDDGAVPEPVPKPVIKWAGGKRALLPVLLRLAPAHFNRYIEPFLGGASVFLALRPHHAILSDANGELVSLYRTVAKDCESVIRELRSLATFVEDSAKYYELRGTAPSLLNDAERAARFIFLNKTGFNGLYRVNRQGQFNVPFGRHDTPPKLLDEDNFRRVAELLARAEVAEADFEETLDRGEEGDFAYLDPPYVPLNATAKFTSYTADSFCVDDQIRLAEAVHRAVARGCSVLLSNSDTPLVHELYGRYTIRTIQVKRSINSDPTKRHKIAEVLVEAKPAGRLEE